MMKGVDSNWGSFFKTPAIFNGEKKGEDGNILTLTPIVQA